jgi:hypothetical protein
VVAVISLLTFAIPNNLLGQAFVPLRGEGTVTLSYQYTNVHDHLRSDGSVFQAGRIYSHIASAQVDYGVTDKLAASFSVPYIMSLYKGSAPHNPDALHVHDPAQEVIDDGTYHGSVQDLGLGVRYNLTVKPFAITPFLAWNQPSHDYPFFAHSAVGRNLWQVNMGASIGGSANRLLPNSYFHLRYAYGITEHTKIDGVSYGGNQSLLRGDFGYFFTERLSAKAIEILQITHGGLNFPQDFPDRTSELWLHHDQILSVGYLELGGGLDYALIPSMDLSANVLKSVWGHNGHSLRMGLAIGVTHYFPRPVR